MPNPQTQQWPADRAVLLVHGVGSAKPGDYDPLVAQLATILAGQPKRYAIYMFYYDYVNEWFSQKFEAPLACKNLVTAIGARLDGSALGSTIADFAGDVIWPILSLDARDAVRTALFRQIRQIMLDGVASGTSVSQQHVSIVCHSLGCFHVYEALHAAAADPTLQLGPAQGGGFDSVIFMASPVQLIRAIGGAIRDVVPRPDDLACLAGTGLEMPSEADTAGHVIPSAGQTVSVAGNLDPVGGYFFRSQLPWAYMQLPNQISRIDQQDVVGMHESDLQTILQQALHEGAPPTITPQNPHDWTGYVTRHADDLRTWLP